MNSLASSNRLVFLLFDPGHQCSYSVDEIEIGRLETLSSSNRPVFLLLDPGHQCSLYSVDEILGGTQTRKWCAGSLAPPATDDQYEKQRDKMVKEKKKNQNFHDRLRNETD